MRKLPTDENGVELMPSEVTPDLSQRRAGGKTIPLVTLVRRYELITPLFGGGVEPGVADPVTLVRGSEIRGHLRFWWRACRGGRFNGDLRAMKEVEDLLWGAASTAKKPRPSQVQIEVEVNNRGQEEQPFQTRTRASQNWRDLAYAAFPLQEALGKVRTGVKFTVTINYPLHPTLLRGTQWDIESDSGNIEKIKKEVEAALWAWETFGGIGARTRRGFGALRNMDAPSPQVNQVQQFIQAGLQQHVTAGTWPSGVPHLAHNVRMKISAAYPNSRAAWVYLIRRLKDFRQSRNPGTAPNRPGRSKWPEPDAIRRLFTGRVPAHTPSLTMPDKFPRAALGLPIVFKFKSDDEAAGDPTKTTLEGQLQNRTRFASPLILRPLACSGGQAVGIAIILQGSNVPPLVLKDAPGNPPVQATLTQAEANAIPPLSGNTDVLQAFLNTL